MKISTSLHVVLMLAFTVFGCSNDSEETPPETEESGDDSADSSNADSTEDSGNDDSGTADGGTDTDTEACAGAEGCYDCEPTQPVHFLNLCTDASCEPFDNEARVPLLEADGSLPPIP